MWLGFDYTPWGNWAGRRPLAGDEHRLVDVDPWAALLEQLMEVPEESALSAREGSNRE